MSGNVQTVSEYAAFRNTILILNVYI